MNDAAIVSAIVVSVAASLFGWYKGTREIDRAAACHGPGDRERIGAEMQRRRVLLALAYGVLSAFAWYLVLLMIVPGEFQAALEVQN